MASLRNVVGGIFQQFGRRIDSVLDIVFVYFHVQLLLDFIDYSLTLACAATKWFELSQVAAISSAPECLRTSLAFAICSHVSQWTDYSTPPEVIRPT